MIKYFFIDGKFSTTRLGIVLSAISWTLVAVQSADFSVIVVSPVVGDIAKIFGILSTGLTLNGLRNAQAKK